MFPVIKKINFLYQKFSNRFKIIKATNDFQISQCLKVRKEVFGEELKRNFQKNLRSIATIDEFDNKSIHLACVDTLTHQTVGSVRINKMSDYLGHDAFIKEYRIDIVEPSILELSCVLSRFAVLKEYRDQIPGFLIIMESYQLILDMNWLLASIVCEPQLFPMYRRLGFRPLGRIQVSPFGGYRLPIGILIHDYDHLKKVCSPCLKLARNAGFPPVKKGIEWFKRQMAYKEDFNTGFDVLPSSYYEEMSATIFDNISKTGLKALMHNATIIDCRQGDKLIVEGGGENYLGILRKGALEVFKNNQVIATLGEGDIFGEISFILHIPRTASIIAAIPGTKVMLLSVKAVNRLKKKEDIIKFWQNLSKVLAQRLMMTSK